MKKKILIAAAVFAVVAITLPFALKFSRNSETAFFATRKRAEAAKPAAGIKQQELAGEVDATAAQPTNSRRLADEERETRDVLQEQKNLRDDRLDTKPLGRVFNPGGGTERKLEYHIAMNYQIDSIKSARAFFNQWIPRYGFLSNESASGNQMSVRVRIRSANLYAALNDLDGIGNLTAESISVQDHTENAVYQQMLAAREEIRARRRTIANHAMSTGNKNWEASENLLSQTEDRQLATRIEEWRIADRIGYASLNMTLSLPAAPHMDTVEVPQFRNAFVGLFNILLQLVYAAIYLIPLALVAYAAYRGMKRILPALRALKTAP